ncbi:MAG: diguanylate cyclase [Candidatus Brocadiae bacterium]|nr:diguanylate cyclase [Candidatus Brocadiia bacterium]
MSYLLALDGPLQGRRFPLAGRTRLGSGAGDEIPVSGLPVAAVEIEQSAQGWFARGTVPFAVNDAPATGQAVRHGDVLAMGGARFQFRNEESGVSERRNVAHLGALYRVAAVITGPAELGQSMATCLEVLLVDTALNAGAVYLTDADTGQLQQIAIRARGGGELAVPPTCGDLPALQSLANTSGLIVLPLVARAHVLGAFVLRGTAPGTLPERDQELATAVSLIASVAAENRRNALQMEEYSRLLMSIEKATMWLSGYLDREPILGEAVGFARSIFKASHVSIVELAPDGSTGRVVRTASRRGDTQPFVVTVGEGMCGQVLATGKPLLSPDPATGRPPEGFQRERRFRTDSFCIVPIHASVSEGADILGAINVADKIGGRPFNERDLELLQVLARAVGVALHNARLYERATVDALTRLFVRQHFFYLLEERIAKARKVGRAMSLAIGDLDDFKKVNDTHGHPAGDAVLRAVGGALRSAIRSGDVAARYGGEEFALILPGATRSDGRAICEGVLGAVRGLEIATAGRVLRTTMSMGLAELRAEDTVESLIARADAAQYRAKYGGKNRLETAE